jgi:hypothetical protein
MSSDCAKAFIARWVAASASERANSQPFLCELCDILGVARPDPTSEAGYAFEYGVIQHHPDGSTTKGRIGLCKRGCFVLESKQFQAAKAAASQLELAAQEAGIIPKKKSSQPVRGTEAWDDAIVEARSPAEPSVRALSASEPNLVCEWGQSRTTASFWVKMCGYAGLTPFRALPPARAVPRDSCPAPSSPCARPR